MKTITLIYTLLPSMAKAKISLEGDAELSVAQRRVFQHQI